MGLSKHTIQGWKAKCCGMDVRRECWMRSWPSGDNRKSCAATTGPELTSRHFLAWCRGTADRTGALQPGKPTQNAHVESFQGRLREECLAVNWFQNLFDARRKIAAWRKEYNEERPQQFGMPHAERVCGGAGGELLHN